jgi:hypothetical protein
MVIMTGRLQGMQPQTTTGDSMHKVIVAAVLAAGLIAAPLAAQAQTASAAQSATPDKKQAKTKKPPTPGQLAARERMKKCAAEWKETKAAGKVEKGMKWPQYWSACNKRLKAAG